MKKRAAVRKEMTNKKPAKPLIKPKIKVRPTSSVVVNASRRQKKGPPPPPPPTLAAVANDGQQSPPIVSQQSSALPKLPQPDDGPTISNAPPQATNDDEDAEEKESSSSSSSPDDDLDDEEFFPPYSDPACLDALNAFYQELRGYSLHFCIICHELWPAAVVPPPTTAKGKRKAKKATPRGGGSGSGGGDGEEESSTTTSAHHHPPEHQRQPPSPARPADNDDDDTPPLRTTSSVLAEDYVCRRCQKDTGGGVDVHKFSLPNDMIPFPPGRIPPEILRLLAEATQIEEMLIAPVLPLMTVFRVRGGGRACRGHCANFSQDVRTFTRVLPRRTRDVPIVIVRRQVNNGSSSSNNNGRPTNNNNTDNALEFDDVRINRQRVLKLLAWLAENNPVYRELGIQIDIEAVEALPVDGYAEDLRVVDEEEEGEEEQEKGEEGEEKKGSSSSPSAGGGQIVGEKQKGDDEAQQQQHQRAAAEPEVGPPEEEEEAVDGGRGITRCHVIREQDAAELQEDAVRRAIMDWPERSSEPINEFSTNGLATMCFPTLFPLGLGDPTNRIRRRHIHHGEGFSHLLRFATLDPLVATTNSSNQKKKKKKSKPTKAVNADDEAGDGEGDPSRRRFYFPFAEHPRFAFWASDLVRRHRILDQTKVYLRQCERDAGLTLEDLRARLEAGGEQANTLIGRMMAYGANITGSSGYWAKRANELLSLVEQRGVPTVFYTFSYADFHWNDLHRLMPSYLSTQSPGTIQERRQNVLANPHLVDWYFTTRLDIFLKHILDGVLEAAWRWHRMEWQLRGAVHAHGVAQLHADPGLTELTSIAYEGLLAERELKELEAQWMEDWKWRRNLSSSRLLRQEDQEEKEGGGGGTAAEEEEEEGEKKEEDKEKENAEEEGDDEEEAALKRDLEDFLMQQPQYETVVRGHDAEEVLARFADQLISAMNPRSQGEVRQAALRGVPDPHPCSRDVCSDGLFARRPAVDNNVVDDDGGHEAAGERRTRARATTTTTTFDVEDDEDGGGDGDDEDDDDEDNPQRRRTDEDDFIHHLDEDYAELINVTQRHVCDPLRCKKQDNKDGEQDDEKKKKKQNARRRGRRRRRPFPTSSDVDPETETRRTIIDCRFGYPKPHTPRTRLEFLELKGGGVKAVLHIQRNDPYMNSHNRLQAHGWRANVDMQIVISVKDCVEYCLKYAAKEERVTGSLQDLIRAALGDASPSPAAEDVADDDDAANNNNGVPPAPASFPTTTTTTTSAGLLRKIMLRTCSGVYRDVGLPETMRLLMSGNHVSAPETTFVNIRLDPSQRMVSIPRRGRQDGNSSAAAAVPPPPAVPGGVAAPPPSSTPSAAAAALLPQPPAAAAAGNGNSRSSISSGPVAGTSSHDLPQPVVAAGAGQQDPSPVTTQTSAVPSGDGTTFGANHTSNSSSSSAFVDDLMEFYRHRVDIPLVSEVLAKWQQQQQRQEGDEDTTRRRRRGGRNNNIPLIRRRVFPEDPRHLNLFDFACLFKVVKKELRQQTVPPHKIIVISYPTVKVSNRTAKNFPQHCRFALTKYKPWIQDPSSLWSEEEVQLPAAPYNRRGGGGGDESGGEEEDYAELWQDPEDQRAVYAWDRFLAQEADAYIKHQISFQRELRDGLRKVRKKAGKGNRAGDSHKNDQRLGAENDGGDSSVALSDSDSSSSDSSGDDEEGDGGFHHHDGGRRRARRGTDDGDDDDWMAISGRRRASTARGRDEGGRTTFDNDIDAEQRALMEPQMDPSQRKWTSSTYIPWWIKSERRLSLLPTFVETEKVKESRKKRTRKEEQ